MTSSQRIIEYMGIKTEDNYELPNDELRLFWGDKGEL